MLILTRRVGEKLRIGDDIEVVVLGVKGNQVRIGIEAPSNVSVHRQEIYDMLQKHAEAFKDFSDKTEEKKPKIIVKNRVKNSAFDFNPFEQPCKSVQFPPDHKGV